MASATKCGLGLVVLAALSLGLGGCASERDDAAASSNDEVVGVTDLGKLESAVGLTPLGDDDGPNTAALETGKCYRALVKIGGYPEYEYRRYRNGAAFFAKKDSGYNSGDKRPIVCVDFFEGESPARSISGVVLDAILRYDLGAFKSIDVAGSDDPRGRFFWNFERGMMLITKYTDEESFAAVRKRAHELELAHAPSISGELLAISVNDVKISYPANPSFVETKSVRIGGAAAFLAYRYAHRKAEDTGVFTIDDDSVGAFKGTASMWGDGGIASTTLNFAHGNLSDGSDGDTVTRSERIVFRDPAAPADRAPLAECDREGDLNEVLPAFKCTGL